MAAGLPDLVDCALLAAEAAVLERVYELGAMPRVKDMLAETVGTLAATFAFVKTTSGRAGATVSIDALPQLRCQRCMQGFALRISGGSEVEFAPAADAPDSERELFDVKDGRVSLRELAEEEFLLALPIAPACSTPATCGRAPGYSTGVATAAGPGEMRRPFSALQDLLKKT